MVAERMQMRAVIFQEPKLEAAHSEPHERNHEDGGSNEAKETHDAPRQLSWSSEEICHKCMKSGRLSFREKNLAESHDDVSSDEQKLLNRI